MSFAATLVLMAEIWVWIGLAISALFLTIGIGRVDEDARGAYVFRPLLVPGIILIWPLVLWRWWIIETGRDDWAKRHQPPRAFHAQAWMVLAVVIPLIFLAALAARQSTELLTPPVLLEAPQ
ncbi:hypothetical protein [Pontivivens insulae]|uniref:Uncharacterized protein n=1 Tax=Pontivivens insulae TaxID=1639689 RepID=A0A2R8AFU4_9RHOB|nr:hypothetical protein [Pontivivens insulae]RED12194.1 hypothetical protein DFR53_2909 [Pontivivens insulae]SPF30950.1 hypothetical protein POI8812_03296 [Pontivivens insulae]